MGRAAKAIRAACGSLVLLAGVLAAAPIAHAGTECWRGWAYWVDGQTGAYKSQEMLVVTKGARQLAPGQSIKLFHLDRQTGQIEQGLAPLVATPVNPRTYYRGRSNYVDGTASVAGASDNLVFGLNQVGDGASDLPATQKFNRWACGLESRS